MFSHIDSSPSLTHTPTSNGSALDLEGGVQLESSKSGKGSTSRIGSGDLEKGGDGEVRVVQWDGEMDTENPLNWGRGKKSLITMFYCLLALQATICSTAFTPGALVIAADFKISTELALCTLTFYLVGFAIGPLVWSPMSEIYGRNYVYHRTWLLYTLIQIPCALATNIETLLVCRFIAGVVGGPAVTVPGGGLSDIWAEDEIGPPIGLFIVSAYMGPIVGPLMGGYLVQYASWRWTFWVCLIIAGTMSLGVYLLPETFSPILLERKARRLRQAQNLPPDTTQIVSPNELHKKSKAAVFRIAIWRPWRLFLEPIVFLVALYIGFMSGVLHLYFAAYPIVFRGLYRMSIGRSGLPFLGIGAGMLLGLVLAKRMNGQFLRLKREYAEKTGRKAYPEGRLPHAIGAALVLPVGILWFAWAGDGKVHWMVPVLSGVPFGYSFVTLLLCLFSYIADSYLSHAASVLASVTLMRSCFSGSFPLFTERMYTELQPKWAGTLIGCIALLFIPIPYLFFRFGPLIRAKSTYTFKDF